MKEFKYKADWAESCWEENTNNTLKRTNYESKANDYSREFRNTGNSYLQKCNFKNERSNPLNASENCKIVCEVDNNSMISNFLLDTKLVPKIKLNTIVEKPKSKQNRKNSLLIL